MYAWAKPKISSLDPEASIESREHFDELVFAPWEDEVDSERAAAEEELRAFRKAQSQIS